MMKAALLYDASAKFRNVCSITVHEQFKDSEYSNDIAVLKTETPIESDENSMPINICDGPDLKGGDQIDFSGWGRLNVTDLIIHSLTIFKEYFPKVKPSSIENW